ncbi:hypothetical protein CDAR_230211 [Caerostris darwini]|uniref:Uncharacterized protein n=1 Tax=Caerostris darwini TaxID=1538125 RepID=A0AAV4MKU6_9ARAC|nr:hypothetical protein CDAR_230211 [Caerostris darwini]
MTERDKVRDAPSLVKQAATGKRGSSVLYFGAVGEAHNSKMLPISKLKFQSTAATLTELAPRVPGKRRRPNLRGARIFWIMSGRAHLRLLRTMTDPNK